MARNTARLKTNVTHPAAAASKDYMDAPRGSLNEGQQMTCQQLSEFIGDYLAGELPRVQRERFESHLAECSMCRRYLDSYGKTIAAAGASARADLPQPLPDELVRAILASRSSG